MKKSKHSEFFKALSNQDLREKLLKRLKLKRVGSLLIIIFCIGVMIYDESHKYSILGFLVFYSIIELFQIQNDIKILTKRKIESDNKKQD